MVKTTLIIDGMMCGMCESHVNDAIRRAFAVKKVKSSHSKGTTEIVSENLLDANALRGSIEKTGYRVLEVHSEPYVKKGLFG